MTPPTKTHPPFPSNLETRDKPGLSVTWYRSKHTQSVLCVVSCVGSCVYVVCVSCVVWVLYVFVCLRCVFMLCIVWVCCAVCVVCCMCCVLYMSCVLYMYVWCMLCVVWVVCDMCVWCVSCVVWVLEVMCALEVMCVLCVPCVVYVCCIRHVCGVCMSTSLSLSLLWLSPRIQNSALTRDWCQGRAPQALWSGPSPCTRPRPILSTCQKASRLHCTPTVSPPMYLSLLSTKK